MRSAYVRTYVPARVSRRTSRTLESTYSRTQDDIGDAQRTSKLLLRSLPDVHIRVPCDKCARGAAGRVGTFSLQLAASHKFNRAGKKQEMNILKIAKDAIVIYSLHL